MQRSLVPPPRAALQHCHRLLCSSACAAESAAASTSGSSSALPEFQHHVTSLASSRAVLRIEGDQGPQFLQGVVSNDVLGLGQPGSSPKYAAIQNPKGKFLHDPILYLERGSGPLSILMEVDVSGKQHAIQWLTRYKLRRPISISDVSNQWTVWAAFGPGTSSTPVPEPQAVGGLWHLDPRLPGVLGLRTVLPASQQPSALQGAAPSSEPEYRTWRYVHGVPEGEVEMPADKTEPLLFNLDELNGVSFSKGCYIGQEKNSFTHYRGVIRRRCMPFRILADGAGGAPKTDEDVVVEGSGERVGTVRGAAVGGVGLVSIKLKPALQAEVGEAALVTKETGSRIQTYRPQWWPSYWGREEEEAAASVRDASA